jgi:hypothetical protein
MTLILENLRDPQKKGVAALAEILGSVPSPLWRFGLSSQKSSVKTKKSFGERSLGPEM